MTKKQKHDILTKLNKYKQILIIFLMILSGIWYVTKGRDISAISTYTHKYQTLSENANSGETSSDNISSNTLLSTESSSDNTFSSNSSSNVTSSGNTFSSNSLSNVTSSDNSSSNDNTVSSETVSADIKQTIPDSSLINLNSATLEELDSLPGIGPSTAQNIINYRNEYGGFADIEELKNVKRIGDKTFAKLKDHITV